MQQLEDYHSKGGLNNGKKFSVFIGVDAGSVVWLTNHNKDVSSKLTLQRAGYGREGVDIDDKSGLLISLAKRIANNPAQFDLQGTNEPRRPLLVVYLIH